MKTRRVGDTRVISSPDGDAWRDELFFNRFAEGNPARDSPRVGLEPSRRWRDSHVPESLSASHVSTSASYPPIVLNQTNQASYHDERLKHSLLPTFVCHSRWRLLTCGAELYVRDAEDIIPTSALVIEGLQSAPSTISSRSQFKCYWLAVAVNLEHRRG